MPGDDAFTYRIVPNYFFDDYDKGGTEIKQVPPRFGLIDSSPARWNVFKAKIMDLNKTAPNETTYRVLYLGRHGQGFHNVAETLYGSHEWNRHWAKLNGDKNMTWGPDPKLTELGIQQAQAVNSAWNTEIKHDMPLPQSLYSSPFTRALHTALITFDGLLMNSGNYAKGQKRPLIKEKLREVNGVHTCDRRSPRSHIANAFPQFDIEANFTEEDELWTADHRETEGELAVRLRQALDDIFNEDDATYISITAHGGAIRALLAVIDAPPRELPTGGVVCFVLEVKRISADQA
ncbi:histidine phosphatase superfamily [Gautieria morchelliformis]|nr:histidine phosphatase superfamily [Gautieria morchelliformis]